MNKNHPNRSTGTFKDVVLIVSLDCETIHGMGLTSDEAWKNAIERTGSEDVRAFAFEHQSKVKTPKKIDSSTIAGQIERIKNIDEKREQAEMLVNLGLAAKNNVGNGWGYIFEDGSQTKIRFKNA